MAILVQQRGCCSAAGDGVHQCVAVCRGLAADLGAHPLGFASRFQRFQVERLAATRSRERYATAVIQSGVKSVAENGELLERLMVAAKDVKQAGILWRSLVPAMAGGFTRGVGARLWARCCGWLVGGT